MTAALAGAVELLERALGYTRVVLAGVTVEDLGRRTPCRDWDLADLLAHMEDALDAFTEAAGGAVGPAPGDPLRPRVDRLQAKACALLGAWSRPVPAPRVERCYAAIDALVEAAGALLVAGSSLTVMSGFRFVRRAARAGVPVVVVNRGATRGDEHAAYKLEVGCSEFLAALAG